MPKTILLLSVVLITGCVSSKATPASVVTEEYAVYETVIESIYVTEGIKLIVIMDHTTTGVSAGQSLDTEMEYLKKSLGAAIESATLNDYETRNEQTQELDRRFSLDAQYVLISESEVTEIFESGDDWSQFYATYPNSPGIVALSRVGFNAEMNQALVYVEDHAAYGSAQGLYVFLTKQEKGWVIQRMIVAWVS